MFQRKILGKVTLEFERTEQQAVVVNEASEIINKTKICLLRLVVPAFVFKGRRRLFLFLNILSRDVRFGPTLWVGILAIFNNLRSERLKFTVHAPHSVFRGTERKLR